MTRPPRDDGRLPRGVSAVIPPRGGRGFRASIRRGKAGEVHLGLYPTAAQAALAFDVAARAIGRNAAPPDAVAPRDQPSAEEVRRITARVRLRLGLDRPPPPRDAPPPEVDRLLTLFEVAVLGFWRSEAVAAEGPVDAAIASSARRLLESAELLFWAPSLGHPGPTEVLAELLSRRLDREFRRGEVTRAVLDDDEDEPEHLARWLVRPDAFPGGRALGFRAEVERLYPAFAGLGRTGRADDWAAVLGVAPPYTFEQVRRAYLARSLQAHPDRGGRPEEFVRLQAAYEAARRHCEAHDL